MNIFEEISYRKIIRKAVEERKSLEPEFNFQAMASFVGIQKSYLSKVVAGSADLNSDQLFLVCEYLRFDQNQRKYMALLLEHERSYVKVRKEQLLAEIREVQGLYRETKEHLHAPKAGDEIKGLSDYYLDPINQIVHICLSIPRYAEAPAQLSKDLGVGNKRVSEALSQLERLGIISRENKKIRILLDDIHLPRESSVYRAWRNSIKLLSIKRLDELDTKSAYSFAVSFSANEEVRDRIQSRFLDFLKQIEGLVKSAPSQGAYQMSFDLFPWTEVR